MAAFHLEGIVSLRNDASTPRPSLALQMLRKQGFRRPAICLHCHSMLEGRQSEDSVSMRIEVVGDETISSQARTYAEYRVFAALTRATGTRDARSARVTLRPLNASA